MTAMLDIWNMALARVGHTVPVADASETSNAANLCRTFYPTLRDMVLREGDWGFARKRVALALLTDTVTNWVYAYGYPSDGVAVRALVLPGQRIPRKDNRVAFEIGSVNVQRAILTDLQQAEAIYTWRVEDPNQWDAMAISALAWVLAAELSRPLVGKPELGADARKAYYETMSIAAAANLNEAETGPMPECEFIAIRGNDFADYSTKLVPDA